MLRHLLFVSWNALQRRQGLGVVRVLVVAVTIATLNLLSGLAQLFLGNHPWLRGTGQLLMVEIASKVGPDGARKRAVFTADELERLTRSLPGVARVTLYSRDPGRVRAGSGPNLDWLDVMEVDSAFFDMSSLVFLAGRAPVSTPGAPAEIVLTNWVAETLFGTEAAVGRTLRWTRGAGTVVGVVHDVEPASTGALDAKIWVNRTRAGALPASARNQRGWGALLQLEPGAARHPVVQAFRARLGSMRGADGPIEAEPRTELGTFTAAFSLRTGLPGFWLPFLVAACLLALIALPAVSLANVGMAGLLERQAEIGVRRAFGASSAQIVLQVLVEALLIVALGGGLALLWPLSLDVILDDDAFFLPGFSVLDWPSFAASLLFIIVLTTVSGLVPALRIARGQPLEALRGSLR